MRTCLSCLLCDNLLRDATTISECLHTFCRKCIYEKITKDKIECCPVPRCHPIEDAEVKAPGSISIPVYSGMEEYASEHALSSFIKEFSGVDWVTAEELRTKEKELEILRMLVQAKSEEVAGLKRLDMVIAEEELRNKETESEILQMLAQAKSEEAAELKVRLDRVTSHSVAQSEQWFSLEDHQKLALEKEQLKKDMGLMESTARMVTAYQMCLQWEKKGGLDRELAVMAKQYWQYRDYVEKQGKSDHFPSLEKYQKEWEDDEVHASPKTLGTCSFAC
ncbi:unnamed protein product [Arabis nemorensis]|uniref:RING-type domain-containing protein n=1 Tax=Arabis nemorensis TaxID=586526 RepID=A0A565ALC6_9BRAS|nr:unnamed protein product [Arabis nemorensis]